MAIDPKTTTELLGALLAEQAARIEKLEKRPDPTLAIEAIGTGVAELRGRVEKLEKQPAAAPSAPQLAAAYRIVPSGAMKVGQPVTLTLEPTPPALALAQWIIQPGAIMPRPAPSATWSPAKVGVFVVTVAIVLGNDNRQATAQITIAAADAPPPPPPPSTLPTPPAADSNPAPLPSTSMAPTPEVAELWDHTDAAAPKLVATMPFAGVASSLRYDHPDLDAVQGTIPTRAAVPVSWGGFDWGALRWQLPGAVNAEVEGEGFHEVVVFARPNENWPGFPAATGYDKDKSETFMPAFKVVLKAADGAILHTYEMHDGVPINDWSLNQGPQLAESGLLKDVVADPSKPIRPHVHCAMALPWAQRRTKFHPKARHWYGGVDPRIIEGTICAKTYSTNPAWPPMSFGSNGRNQSNGVAHFRYMLKRPRPANAAFGTEPSQDPNIRDWWTIYPAPNQRAIGWGYDPGNPGGIDQYTGPGGVRFDRGGFATPLVEAITDPKVVNLQSGVTYSEILEHTSLNAFNLAFHLTGDVATGAPALKAENTFAAGDRATSKTAWSVVRGYYLSQTTGYVPGGRANSFDQVAIGQGGFDGGANDAEIIGQAMRFYRKDPKTGKIRRPWNGSCIDNMHAHQFWGVLAGLKSSPMHAWHLVHQLNMSALVSNTVGMSSFMARPAGWWKTEQGAEFSYEGVITREKAYKFFHLAIAWFASNNHPHFGISRAEVEAELARYLRTYHTNVYLPKMSAASESSPYWQALKRFGMQATIRHGSNYGDAKHYMRLEDTPARCYFVFPLAFATQIGLIDRLFAMGSDIETALRDLVATLDTYSVEGVLDAGYVQSTDYLHRLSPIKASAADLTIDDLAMSWKDLATRVAPPVGKTGFLRNADGLSFEYSAWAHIQGSWAIGAHHYLRGHFPHPRSQEAFDFITGRYDEHRAWIASLPVAERWMKDWTYLHPVHGPMAAPAAA